MPIDPRSGYPVDAMNPSRWLGFDDALALWETDTSIAGIGFALTDDLVLIDLDGVRDAETGVLADWASELVESAGSYSEVSVSGTGVHILVRGTWKGINEWQATEIKRRVFTPMTGHRLPGAPAVVRKAQQMLDALEASPRHKVAKRFVNDAGFRKLHNGATPSKYRSRETADDAFARSLFWMLDDDREAVERALRRSRRYRSRWDAPTPDGQTYLDALLDTAGEVVRIERLERNLALERDPVEQLRRAGGKATKTRETILRALSGLEAPIMPLALANLTGLSRSQIQHSLSRLADTGIVERTANGYVLPPLMSSKWHSNRHSGEIVDLDQERQRRRVG